MARNKPEYIAQRVINVNGVRAYNPGDGVPASAVENLGLVVGEAVVAADPSSLPRPAGNARRAEWEAYWRAQGVPQDELDEATRDELAAREAPDTLPAPDPDAGPVDVPAERVAGVQMLNAQPADADQPDQAVDAAAGEGEVLEPPGPNARKAEWVDYAVGRGMDRQTARESTIDQLAGFDYDTAYGQ